MSRPTAKMVVWQALHDAIDWQKSLADAWPEGSEERQEALDQAKRYRAMLKRRYGSSKTALDQELARGKLVTLAELRGSEGDR